MNGKEENGRYHCQQCQAERSPDGRGLCPICEFPVVSSGSAPLENLLPLFVTGLNLRMRGIALDTNEEIKTAYKRADESVARVPLFYSIMEKNKSDADGTKGELWQRFWCGRNPETRRIINRLVKAGFDQADRVTAELVR